VQVVVQGSGSRTVKIITENPPSWGGKVNFVDNNNTVVGYDLSQDCCEHAGWYISEGKHTDDNDKRDIPDVEDYAFDRAFFEQVEGADVDAGGMVRFRLVADGEPDLFLHIFNSHNGYYGHGFTVHHSGQEVYSGTL